MEKIVYLKNINEIEKYIEFDSFLIESIFSSCYQNIFLLDDIHKLVKFAHNVNKKVYLRADKILIEKEIMLLKKNKDILNMVDGVFFEDFAFVDFFKENNIKTELIYFPYDAIGDKEDISAIMSMGIDKICLPSLKEELILKTN